MHLKVHFGEDLEAFKYGGNAYAWAGSAHKRAEYYDVKRNRPHEAQSVYQCNPGQREGSIFLDRNFCYYRQPTGYLEDGVTDTSVKDFVSRGRVVIGWDTAANDSKWSAYTVGVVGLLVPCQRYHNGEDEAILGQCDFHYDVFILDVFRGQPPFTELVQVFRRMHMKWQPSIHVLEQKMTGIPLFQTMTSIGLHIEGVEAAESKLERIRQSVGVASVEGWFGQHRVYFPSEEAAFDDIDQKPRMISWLAGLKGELKDFTGDQSATDDQVDALTHLVRYAILQSSSASILPTGWSIETIDQEMGFKDDPYDPNLMPGRPARMLSWINNLNIETNIPFLETCGNCVYYGNDESATFCRKHKRNHVSFDTCDDFYVRR